MRFKSGKQWKVARGGACSAAQSRHRHLSRSDSRLVGICQLFWVVCEVGQFEALFTLCEEANNNRERFPVDEPKIH
jgi:hypothetical protein